MYIPTFVFIIFIEIVLVILLIAFILIWKTRRRALALETEKSPVTDDWFTLLTQNINETKSRINELRDLGQHTTDEFHALGIRLKVLTAENEVETTNGPQTVPRLQDLIPTYSNLISGLKKSYLTKESPSSKELIKILKQRILNFESRVQSLEKFKTLFNKLKSEFNKIESHNLELNNQINNNIPQDKQSEELKKLLLETQKEKSELHKQLEFVEHEFEALLSNFNDIKASTEDNVPEKNMEAEKNNLATSMNSINGNVDNIKNVILNQESKIKELNQEIQELSLKVDDLSRLEQISNELASKNEEMSNVIAVFEDENDFLQKQIQEILTQEHKRDMKKNETIEKLEREAVDLENKCLEMEKKYTEIEKEYAAITEELSSVYLQQKSQG